MYLNPHNTGAELDKIRWLLYDAEIIKKLDKANITSIEEIMSDEKLLLYQNLKRKISENSPKRNILSVDNYKSIKFELFNESGELKEQIKTILKGECKNNKNNKNIKLLDLTLF